MSLEQVVEANTTALREFTAALTKALAAVATKEAPAAPAPAATPKGRKVSAPDPTPPEPAATPAADAPATPKYEEVTAAVLALVGAKGRPAAVNILTDFGVVRATEFKPEQYAEVIAKCQAAMADAPIV